MAAMQWLMTALRHNFLLQAPKKKVDKENADAGRTDYFLFNCLALILTNTETNSSYPLCVYFNKRTLCE